MAKILEYLKVFILTILPTTICAATAPFIGETLKGIPCTGKEGGLGPFDYTDQADRRQLRTVEQHHLTAEVLQLKRGETAMDLGNDIQYTLMAYPNHHLALNAMGRYQVLKKRKSSARYSEAECYFERAINFRPNDGTARMLYAIYLHKRGAGKKALEQYKSAEQLIPNNSEFNYNYALLLIDLKHYAKAEKFAKKAYSQGYPLMGAKNKLKRLGYWK